MTIDERINYLIEQVKELHDEPKMLSEDDIYGIIEALDKAKQSSQCIYCEDCYYYKPMPDLFAQSPTYTGRCDWWNGHATIETGHCYKGKIKEYL